MPWFAAGTPCQYFLPLKISRPKKRPFCDFFRFCTFLCTFSESRARYSDYVQNFIPFRTNPILYNNLYIFGMYARWRRHENPRLYRNGRGRSICSDFVFILFILGNMIQKYAQSVLLEKKSLEKHCNK